MRFKMIEEYQEVAWKLEFDPETSKLADTPIPFRFDYVDDVRAEAKGSQMLRNFLNTESGTVLKTDDEMGFKPKDKILMDLEKNDLNEYKDQNEITSVRATTDKGRKLDRLRGGTQSTIYYLGLEK
jgi:hypothetical protein